MEEYGGKYSVLCIDAAGEFESGGHDVRPEYLPLDNFMQVL
jgi:hypothetical protein